MSRIQSTPLSLLALRCPRCHEGPLFKSSAFNLSKFTEMPEHCPVCGQTYEPEPGFYWGAMFISYAFTVAIFVTSGVLLYWLAGDPALWVYIATVSIAALLTMPLVLRYSRALMLYLFGGVRYEPNRAAGTSRP
ncbi:DUF983 domain-containing protein [Hymenobacter koreensis]|uniref:DUF983 domain-containing protein n=1 Tax=Hymenobacter koreensis TaxID=1084523 RepID=A0ABP8IV21_9BACT